jgi:MFS family permease
MTIHNSPFTINTPRLAVLAAFFVNGAMLGTWVSRIPAVQLRLGMSEGELGLVLLGMAVGVLVALSLAGGLVGRFGSRLVTAGGAVAMCPILVLLSLVTRPLALWLALFAFGAAMSSMDVAMNAQAVVIEQRAKRPLMSSFHASFSIGGLFGALLGAGFTTISGEPLIHFAFAAVLFLVTMLVASRHLLTISGEKSDGGALFRLPPRALWALGAIAFCTAIGEGAMADWSGVYLARTIGTTAAVAALGFAAFSVTMTLGRLLGDRLAMRFDSVRIVRFGGLLTAVGLLVAILTGQPIVVLIGFAAVGAGLANNIPLAFSTAGNYPGISSSAGIAGVATIGYAGFLAGPPVIGIVAEATSLRIALLLVALLAGSLIFTAQAIRPGIRRPSETTLVE